MDPDANLAEQRRLIKRIRANAEGKLSTEADALRLAELVESLDEWIRHGGFLPELWDRRRTVEK